MDGKLHTMVTPTLKWAGGKRAMLDDIMPRLLSKSNFGYYFEPFFDDGAVFFSMEPSNSIINDINPKLINFYKQITRNRSGSFNRIDYMTMNTRADVKMIKKTITTTSERDLMTSATHLASLMTQSKRLIYYYF
jgi:site-specific DNA-adenine methylase